MDETSDDPMIGRRIRHYRILQRIGGGRQGVVYRARNERLDNHVALKVVLHSTFPDLDSRRITEREARALAQISHPSVVVVHDFIDDEPDCDCIVMELVEGESLKARLDGRPLPQLDALRLGYEMASGLAAMHEAGVIHRDLKPDNLRVPPRGVLKIVDLGLAKATPRVPAEPDESGTRTDEAKGTRRYMPPELGTLRQGEAWDLYAAGVVLYEMATGVHPFEEHLDDLDHATAELTAPPPRQRNPDLSRDFDAVILRCLEKDPAHRPSARSLAEELEAIHSRLKFAPAHVRWKRWATAGLAAVLLAWVAYKTWPRPPRPSMDSLAVLLFMNASGDGQQAYLSEGITEALIHRLGEQKQLRVPPLSAVRVYAPPAPPRPLPVIASELKVQGIVEGSVWISAERMRILVRLVDARVDSLMWSGEIDADRADLSDLHTRVARSIAREIGLKLGKGAGPIASTAARVDSAAYDQYLQGRFQWNRRSDEGVRNAIEHFRRAIDRDSSFALAYSGLADAWATRGIGGMIPPKEAAPLAMRAALRARELGPELSEVHVSLGNILQNFEWDWKGAERAYRKAIQLRASNAHAHHWYANHLALRGRDRDAMVEIERAQELDPFSLPINVGAGAFHYYARRYANTERECRRVFAQDSTSADLNRVMAASYIQLGRDADAARAIQRWLDHAYPAGLASRAADGYRNEGLPGMLRVVLYALEARRSAGHYVPATSIAELHALLRERERALHWLERAYEENDTQLNRLRVDPIFDPLRGEPRFQQLVHRIGLAPRPRCGGASGAGR